MPRIHISITLPKECVDWLDKRVESRIFHNRSHALEVVILKAMEAKELVKENGE